MSGDYASQRREQRKQDLLLASRLARMQATAAFDQLATRADHLADRVAKARALLASPAASLVGAALAAALLGMALRRRRAPARRAGLVSRLARWGWLGWRVWRVSGPLLARLRETH